jgi:hypothetical protein
VYLPTYGHTNAPMGFEMLYVIAIAIFDAGAAKMLHFGAGIFCLTGLWLAGRRLAGAAAGVCAITLLMLPNPLYTFAFLFSQAYIELAVCWLTMASVFLFIVWHEEHEDRFLLGAALCAGFAGSFKFPALCIGTALAMAVVVSARSRREGWRRSLWLAGSAGVAATLPVLPWLFRNWRLTGNPVYPMFASVLPSRDWTPEQGRVFSRYFRYFNWAQQTHGGLTEGHRKLLILLFALLIIAGFGVAFRVARSALFRAVMPFALVPMLAWLAIAGLYFRFWLPGIQVLWLLVATALAALAVRRAIPVTPIATAGLGVTLAAFIAGAAKDPSGLFSDVRLALGLTSVDQEYAADPFWRSWDYLRNETPPGSHVLFASFFTTFGPTSAGGCYWVNRPCYATDSHLQGYIRFNRWSEFLQDIQKADIAYVVVGDHQPLLHRLGFTAPTTQNEYPFCRRLVEEYGDEERHFADVHVYRLRPLPDSASDAP